MRRGYKVVWEAGTGEITEKKSRFIADIRPVETEEEILAFQEETKKKYWDARHHCYAYILGVEQPVMRCSDDGEPSQTAGRPMLDVLLGAELHNVCAIVTRYFGGTLLGTGGLVRAYSQAVKEGLSHTGIIEKIPGEKWSVGCDYTDLGRIQYLAAQKQIRLLHTEYAETVQLICLLPEGQEKSFLDGVTEATGGRAVLTRQSQVYFAEYQKEILLFEE